MTNPQPEASRSALRMIFAGLDDVCDPVGRIRFGANPLERVARARGLPQMMVREVVPQDDGSCLVYGYQCPHNLTDIRWRIFRCRTYDGITFDEVEKVHESAPGHWYGSTEIAQNRRDGSFLCLKWGPGQMKGAHAMWAYGSPDGTRWSPLLDRPVYHDHDAFSAAWDPASEQYVSFQATYQKHARKPFRDNAGPDIRRVLHFRTSKDGVNWTPSEDVARLGYLIPEDRLVTPDDDDPPELEFYRLTAFPYADRYVGMMLNYAPTPLTSGHGPHLGGEWWVGDDFRTWRRPFRDVFAPGPASNIVMHPPMTMQGRHLWVIGHDVYGLPEDRIFYAGSLASAAFTTRPFVAPEKRLALNASFPPASRGFQGQSYIMVEVLDESGAVIEEFEKEKCLLRAVEDRTALLWGEATAKYSMSSLAGRTVRLRIHFRDARIYSVSTVA